MKTLTCLKINTRKGYRFMVTLRSESRFLAKIEIDIARIIALIVVRFVLSLS